MSTERYFFVDQIKSAESENGHQFRVHAYIGAKLILSSQHPDTLSRDQQIACYEHRGYERRLIGGNEIRVDE